MTTERLNEAAADASAAPAAPPWPLGLRLDELWLRTRRVAVEQLGERGLWPGDERYAAVVEQERELGRRLARELLPPLIGDELAGALAAGALFGPAGPDVARQLPLMLRFGALLAGERAELGALFNLGISLLDCHVDGGGDRSELIRRLTPESVRLALVEPGAVRLRRRPAIRRRQPELDVVLALASAFLDGAGQVGRGDPVLIDDVTHALRAELASIAPEAAPEVAREKSTRPFAILARLAGDPADDGRDLGLAFWLLDDVVDLVADLRDGSVNGLLPPRAEPAEAAATLLRDDRVERAAAHAAAALAAVTARWQDRGEEDRAVRICCYARDWVR
jgi:hypothetical protein